MTKLVVGKTLLKLTPEGLETLRAATRKIKHDAKLRGVFEDFTSDKNFILVRLPTGDIKTYARRFWEVE